MPLTPLRVRVRVFSTYLSLLTGMVTVPQVEFGWKFDQTRPKVLWKVSVREREDMLGIRGTGRLRRVWVMGKHSGQGCIEQGSKLDYGENGFEVDGMVKWEDLEGIWKDQMRESRQSWPSSTCPMSIQAVASKAIGDLCGCRSYRQTIGVCKRGLASTQHATQHDDYSAPRCTNPPVWQFELSFSLIRSKTPHILMEA